jgi:hypothetical protein
MRREESTSATAFSGFVHVALLHDVSEWIAHQLDVLEIESCGWEEWSGGQGAVV